MTTDSSRIPLTDPKHVEEIINRISTKRAEILDQFAEAYLAELGCKPSDVCLVQKVEGAAVKFWFEKNVENKLGST